ncbi:MAG: hypothetical protein Q8P50_01435 [Bacillota bacterium]|nr:hypothetical protein [Bacillota bacterium]
MLLGTRALRQRLDKGEIFHPGIWVAGSIKEASYALRVASDGLMVEGEQYPPHTTYPRPYIVV